MNNELSMVSPELGTELGSHIRVMGRIRQTSNLTPFGGQASKANQCLQGCNHEETNTIAGMRAIVNNILLFAQNGLAFCTDVGYLAETWIHQK